MYFTVITLNGMVIYCNTSLAQIRISFQRALLSEIIQGRNNFKSRSRRILPHSCTVQKTAVCFIIDKCIPVFGNCIWIKIWFTDQGQDFSCGWFQSNNRSSSVTKRIICSGLQVGIQSRDNGIPCVFGSHKFVTDLI